MHLRYMILTLLCGLWLAAPAPAKDSDEAPLAAVMKAVRADDWAQAAELARGIGPVAEDIVSWRRLRAGEGDFADYRAFLARRSDWPGLDRLRVRGEGTIPDGADPAEVVAYFDGRAPATGQGALRLIAAYRALGRAGDAEAQAVLTWRSLPLDAKGHADLLDAYGRLLAPHHAARLDEMLWQGADDSARLVLPLVDAGWRALAVARMTLRARGPGVDALVAAVPEALAGDGGLAWERFDWRRAKARPEDAIALMDERSIGPDSLGRPERWANWRRIYARQMMREGQAELAYRLAANHFLVSGEDYADLEWLAGFIALRRLGEPEVALAHFHRFRAAVETPISLSRAGYWEGRALEALGRRDAAQAAYADAGQHQTAFYGQLAAEKAGLAMDPALTGTENYPDWRQAPFAGSSLIEAARLFHEAGERNLVEWFLTHLAEGAGPEGQAQLAGLALDWDEPHVALRIAKVAAGQGTILPRAYFPLTGLAGRDHPVPAELVLSIARRESEFDPGVTSGAGARGLMQLMPGTARLMAGALEIDFVPERLLSDPDYNATLGAAYLARLAGEFGNNVVLVAAGYNAGPGRPRSWIEEYGDPRSAGVDVVDWIETIPFRETRNYVMRVAESLAIYRARLSGQAVPLRLSAELRAQ
ncbi:lytic transglycosylase domain-containing protein [Actibacterium sp. MT2.3-13A]|uniref:lytic transglycosylase domain-containing protein n=1 Tax=Actibacterium sp. MT2.3-13A TaxID=2828332 RepID=UPI001BAD0D03|nr:lytic transglycosylase domain-containing protein [Actibacterium sp. MT2.3-13A]